MTKLRKFTLVLGLIFLLIFAILTWYKLHYSMEIAKSFTVTVPHAKHNLLIATQGSAYKNAVVEGVIEATKGRQMTIEVIDVSALSNVKIEDWNAIVVIHTWENWQPQMEAAKFAQQHPNLNKVIFLATSGKGDLSIPGVDAITSASLLADVPKDVADIVRKIDTVLAASTSPLITSSVSF